jgi:hypothetical protein
MTTTEQQTEQQRRRTFTDRMRAFFLERPGVWVEARDLEAVGGRQAWRTRVSDCRVNHGMVIRNRLRREDAGVVSEYCYEAGQ